jgi:hypothetical protein
VATFVTVVVFPRQGEADSIVSLAGVNRCRQLFSIRISTPSAMSSCSAPQRQELHQARLNLPMKTALETFNLYSLLLATNDGYLGVSRLKHRDQEPPG